MSIVDIVLMDANVALVVDSVRPQLCPFLITEFYPLEVAPIRVGDLACYNYLVTTRANKNTTRRLGGWASVASCLIRPETVQVDRRDETA